MGEQDKNLVNPGKTSLFKRIALRLSLALLMLILLFPVIIHLGPVQKIIINSISSTISEKTGSEVDIDHVRFSLFKGLVLKDVYISNANEASDTLAYLGEFSSSLEENILSLVNKRLHLEDLNIFEASVRIRQGKTDSINNLQRFIVSLSGNNRKNRKSSGEPLDLMLKNINLRNLNLSIENERNASSTLAKLAEGHVGIKSMDLRTDSFEIHSISLLRPEFIIAEGLKDETLRDTNQVKQLNVQDTSVTNPGAFVRIGLVEITDGKFQRLKADSLKVSVYSDAMNINDLDIHELNLEAQDIIIERDGSIKSIVEGLSLKEKNGFVLEDLKVDSLFLGQRETLLRGMNIRTDSSEIKDYLSLRYNGFSSFRNFAREVHIQADMTGSELALSDLAYFVPGLRTSKFMRSNNARKLTVTGRFDGTIDKFEGDNLYLTIDKLVELSGQITGTNITDPEKALVNLYVSNLKTSLSNLRQIIPGFKPPRQFYKLDPISFRGDIEGFFKDFVIYGYLNSRLGKVTLDTRLNTKKGVNEAEYSGELALNNFDLRRWTGNEDFGFATLTARIGNGKGLTLENVSTDLQATLEKFEFKDYAYSNVKLEGILEKNLFDGIFSVRDPNVEIDFEGQIAIRDNYFKSDFEAFIQKINPAALNLDADYTDVSGNFNLSIEGATLNDFSGSAEFNDFKLIFKEKEFDFNQLYFSSAPGTQNRRNLLLTSDIINASIEGKFDFSQLVPAFTNHIRKHHPQWADKLKFKKSTKEITKEQNFAYKFEVFDTRDYLELLNVNDLRFRGVTLEGDIDLNDNRFSSTIKIDSSFYRDYEFTSFGLALTNNRKISKLLMDLERISTSGKMYEPLSIKSEMDGDEVILSIQTRNVLDSVGYVDLTLNMRPVDDKILLNISNKNLQMFSTNWEIDESNKIVYGKNYLGISDFVLSDGYRTIFIQDYKKSGVEFNLDNFDFLLVNGLINYDKIDFAGEGSIYARIANIFKKPSVVADIRIPEFTLNNVDYGALAARIDDDGDKAYASFNLNRVEDDLRLLFNAEFNKKTKALTGEVTSRNLVMKTFEFIIDDGISDTQGIANIDVKISGTTDDIKLNGSAKVIGGQTRINYIGTLLDLGSERFTITEKFIDLTGVSLYDRFGNQATMTGGLRHDLFGDFRTDLNMSSDRFMALDTDKSDNNMYYGVGIGEISVDFFGPFSSTDISITATTGQGTVLNIPVEDTYYNVDESFIKFVPREEILNRDERIEINESVKLEGVDVDMNLSITEDALVNIIFDERMNDIIRGSGDGDLRITVSRDGKFNIYGEYVVARGEYLFTAWGIVAKPFKVRRGGLITWTGDPVNANLNIEADYDDLRAPVNVLLAEYLVATNTQLEQEARKRTRIDLTLNIGGTLYNPIVNFDIDFPELQGELRTYADSKMITLRENEADLNEQVAGLIMFRSFLPSSSLGNVFTTGNSFVQTGYNTLSEFISNQLSYLLSGFLQEALTNNGFISGIDFEIGFSKNANILEGAPQSDNYLPDEIEVHFKPRFQNDKWGFDYGTSFVNSNGQSTRILSNYVIHDFVLEYYLTPDRRLKLRAYGKWDKDEVVFENEQKYGLGINYRKEFGSITDFQKALTRDISNIKGNNDSDDQPN